MPTGVEFEEWKPNQQVREPNTSKMASWLIRKGIAHNKSQANMMLLLVAAVFFGLSLIFFFA